ncbi:MAG TPA: hypothetical protein VGY56_13755 [Verrucomicrobiae bacterium]|nr:hypothetical protein [Verrucomicrobiae bacterium]
MKYPSQLSPTAVETVKLPSGKTVKIAKATPVFKLWTGKAVKETYGGKAVLDFYGQPQFAELGILRIFEREGWQGVWVDTYRNKYRTSYWPKDSATLPDKQAKLLEAIYKANGTRSGCFDVFCWKGRDYIFAESKRCDQDKLRETQKQWIASAIKADVPLRSLLVVEWGILTIVLPKPETKEWVYSARLGRPVLIDLQYLSRERKAGKI